MESSAASSEPIGAEAAPGDSTHGAPPSGQSNGMAAEGSIEIAEIAQGHASGSQATSQAVPSEPATASSGNVAAQSVREGAVSLEAFMKPAQTFDLAAADDDDDAVPVESAPGVNEMGRVSSPGGALGGNDVTAQVREKYKWLCLEDQKIVCRRECQLAQEREEALIKQIHQTIDRYTHAIEVSKAVASSGTNAVDEGEPNEGALPPELVAKYEERIQLLHGTIAALVTEPTVALPKLTALEKAKGFAFHSYSQTARMGGKLAQKAPALGGARAALSSFASRTFGSGSGAEALGVDAAAAAQVAQPVTLGPA